MFFGTGPRTEPVGHGPSQWAGSGLKPARGHVYSSWSCKEAMSFPTILDNYMLALASLQRFG